MYGIEKKYGVSGEDLRRANPFIEEEGLQIGQTLVIPVKNKIINTAVVQDKVIIMMYFPKKLNILFPENMELRLQNWKNAILKL
jgi:hypothetical protein